MTDLAPGWHPHPSRPGKYAYFDGRRWDDDVRDAPPGDRPNPRPARSPTSPLTILWVSVGVSVIGGLLIGIGTALDSDLAYVLGVVVGALGGIAFTIGAAAYGALLAIRYDRATRS